MKKYLFVLIAISLIALSCAKTKKPAEENQVKILTTTIGSPKADSLIWFFLNEPTLHQIATTAGHAGVLPIDDFVTKGKKNDGILLWFCYDGAKDFFVASEYLDDYDPNNLPTAPISKTLTKSYSFRYSTTDATDINAVDAHIQNDNLLPPNPPSYNFQTITNAEATQFVAAFKNKMGGYCAYAFSCFTENKKIRTTLPSENIIKDFHDLGKSGNGKFLRYYFGFDNNQVHNKIRVVLVALDKDGKKMPKVIKSGTLDDGSLVESSFPPPPPVN